MATIVEYYEVRKKSGLMYDSDYVIAKFSSHEEAENFKNMTKDTYVNKCKKRIVIYDTAEEANTKYTDEMKEQALKKLTIEERLALGV